jgi:starch phosphorylase
MFTKKNRRINGPSLGMDTDSLRDSIALHLTYSLAKTKDTATDRDWYNSLVLAVRDRLVERFMATTHEFYENDVKRVYYLSLEFLIGRSLTASVLGLGIESEIREAMSQLGHDYEKLYGLEDEAALGNGGLGRLAACLLDSLASQGFPGYGYGIRYEYGMFNQRIEGGVQVEHPENWLRYGNPWEFPRSEVIYPVYYGGRVLGYSDDTGLRQSSWLPGGQVMAMAYDMPIPGFHNGKVNNLRLWAAKATREFELQDFQVGDYIGAVEHKTESENLSKVLYPSDETGLGKELRLKQEYFFISASLQDIMRRFLAYHDDLEEIPQKIVIQLNDTHPALAVVEWMRLLLDRHHLSWETAWKITRATFAYTNHTLLPEALETWPVAMLEHLLPRHLQIIYKINHGFLKEVTDRFPGDIHRLRRMSLIDEGGERRVRMANLAIVGSHRVNGVSKLHSQLLKEQLFADFNELYPDLFLNITNGITPRRWLYQANPNLSELITEYTGAEWQADLSQLRRLEPLAEDPEFRARFREVKRKNKEWLAQVIEWRTAVKVHPDSLYDVQVKRIHEYKRQHLCLLHAIVLFNRIRHMGEEWNGVPRTIIFGGKAAPSYQMAKDLIRLIHDVADVINNDPLVGKYLKVVFIPNYDVSTAATVIPAAELSEQISTAGMEASGTGNMKLALNGALTIGTLDGANIEIREEVGEENFFLFGLRTEEVNELRARGYDPAGYRDAHGELHLALEQIGEGFFTPEDPERHRALHDNLLNYDPFMVLADFADYLRCQREVEELYRDPEEWTRRAVLNVARMGRFSSDRTVQDYASKVWGIESL